MNQTDIQVAYEANIRALVLGSISGLTQEDQDQYQWDSINARSGEFVLRMIDASEAGFEADLSVYELIVQFDYAHGEKDKLGMQYWLRKLAKKDAAITNALWCEYKTWCTDTTKMLSYYSRMK